MSRVLLTVLYVDIFCFSDSWLSVLFLDRKSSSPIEFTSSVDWTSTVHTQNLVIKIRGIRLLDFNAKKLASNDANSQLILSASLYSVQMVRFFTVRFDLNIFRSKHLFTAGSSRLLVYVNLQIIFKCIEQVKA